MLCATNAPSLRKGTSILTSNCELRTAVVWKITVTRARSASLNGMLRMRTGRTFSTMPQSNNQTSPRLGGTFLLAHYRGQCVAGGGGNIIVERAGIPRRKMVNDFPHELLLFFDWQRLEVGKQFCCGGTHAKIIKGIGKDVSRKPVQDFSQ